MIDLVKLQEDWTFKLLSEPALDRINIVQLRKLVIESKLDVKLLTLKSRNGRNGCGAIVEMPVFGVTSPAAPGPEGEFEISVLVSENPILNMVASTGTLMQAEEVSMRILEIGHKFFMRDVAEFSAAKNMFSRNAVEPVEVDKGLVSYRVSFGFRHSATPAGRVSTPLVSETGGRVTLTCSTAGASIFFTLDDSFPGPGNPAAARYESPFQVDTGTILRVAAYAESMTGSDVDRGTINF
jgi:hypothetical protein